MRLVKLFQCVKQFCLKLFPSTMMFERYPSVGSIHDVFSMAAAGADNDTEMRWWMARVRLA